MIRQLFLASVFSIGTVFAAGKDISVKIKGMTCGDCAQKVEASIKKINGVESVSVNHSTGEASIKVKDKASVTPDQIKKAVTEAGFEFVG